MNKIKDKILNNEVLKSLDGVFKKHEIYIVGGFLRDLFFDKSSFDIDLAVADCSAETLADEIAKNTNGTKILLDSKNGIYRVVAKDKKHYFDIVNFFENDISKDIKRRDFTVNSLFFDINKKEFFDPINCVEDIKNKILKTSDLENFVDDPLRMLRAFRFKSVFSFEIAPEILDFIQKNAKLINMVAPERINYEIIKTFEGENLVSTLLEMQKIGFLNVIFPILKEVEKIPPNSHHHLPLIMHSIECIKYIEQNNPLLKLAALLHDIGKPSTWTIEEDTGRHRFFCHDEIGAKLAKKILENLKFSKKQVNYICKMIQNHIYPSALMGNENKTDKAMVRFIKKLSPDIEDIVELARADRLSARGEAVSDKMIEKNLKNLQLLLEFYKKIEPTLLEMPKLIDGNEIKKLTGVKGKKLGEIIDELKEAQLLGNVKTKDEAIKFIQNIRCREDFCTNLQNQAQSPQ